MSEWISVYDKMPNHGKVLAYCKLTRGNDERRIMVEAKFEPSEGWSIYVGKNIDYQCRVTHWKQLPQAPHMPKETKDA